MRAEAPLVGRGDAALGGDLQEQGEEHGPVGGRWARVEFASEVEAERDDEDAADCEGPGYAEDGGTAVVGIVELDPFQAETGHDGGLGGGDDGERLLAMT